MNFSLLFLLTFRVLPVDMHLTILCARSAAVYMCEWEKMKPAHANPEGEQGGEDCTTAAKGEEQEVSEEASHPKQPPASAGVTYELCAGIVDKPHLSLEEIACQEVLEECGYEVPVSKLRRITSYRCGYTPLTQNVFFRSIVYNVCHY